MAKKSNFLKNLLTTASAMAVITSGASSAYAADGDGFSVLGADPAAVGGGANEFIENATNTVQDFTNTYNIINFVNGGGGGGDINVGHAKTIGSYNVYGNNGNTITVNGVALSLGVVYNDVSAASKVEADAVNGAAAAQGGAVGARVNLTVQTANIVTLTGVAAVANGGAAPVGAVANRYDSLGVIDFTGNGGTLLNNAANTIDAGTTVTGADTAGILDVVQNLTVKNASFATFVDNQIRGGRTLAFDVGTNNIATAATSTYTFADNAAIISFKVDATNGKSIDLQNDLVDTVAGDNIGRVVFENSAVAGAPNALTVTSTTGGKTIGTDSAHRFTAISFAGQGDVVLDANITPFALLISQAGTGKATITNAADLGAAGSDITFAGNGKLEFLGAVTSTAANVTNGGELILRANSFIGDVAVTNGKLTADTAELTGDLSVDANGLAVGGASASVKKITGNAGVQRGGVLSVVEDITGALDAGNAGSLVIVNLTGDGNVGGPIGATQLISKISVSGNRTFADAAFGNSGAAGLTELNFAASGKKVTLNNAGASLLATDVTLDAALAATPGDSVIEVQAGPGNAQAITGAINATGVKNADGNFGLTIKVMGGVATDVEVDNAHFKANLVSDQADVVKLTFGANTAGEVGNLGSDNARFVNTIFDQGVANVVSVGDIYSKDITVNAGRKTRYKGKVVSDKVTLGGVDSQAIFADGVHLRSKVVGTAGEGIVDFEGGALIDETISGVKLMRFTAAAPATINDVKVARLNKSIASTTIQAGYAMLYADSNVAVSGATTARFLGASAGKTLTTNNGPLALQGQAYIASEVADINGVVKAGKVSVEDNLLNLDNLDTTKVVVDDSKAGTPVEGAKFTVFQNQVGVIGGKNFQGKLAAEVDNTFTDSLATWTATSDGANIYITSKDNSAKKLEEAVKNAGASSDDLANLNAAYTDADIAKEIAGMNGASRVELAQRLVASDVEAVLGDLTTRIGADLGSRMGTLAGSQGSPVQTKVVSNGTTGLSAGDDVNRYGAWISPFFNKSTQKSRKGAAGYTATTGGGSFGFDTKANDDMIVGLALSMLHTDVKHKNFKSGDKTKVDSVMFSVYGMQQITDNWFAQGLVTAGSSKVSTNEQRKVTNTTYQKASGKYTSMSFSGEALLGYNYVMDQVSITPMGGVRLTRVNDGGYKETGTTNQNLTISRKALNKAELVLGARVAGGTFDLNGLSVTPEIHGFLNQDVVGKASKVDMTLKSGGKLVDKSAKPNKTTFNVGVGLNATYNSMEYGAGYDAHLANKFVGHQGTLKVRVNF
jgi:outer membrane autotransporter protein